MSTSEQRLINRIFAGEVIILPPSPQSLALVEAIEKVIGEGPQ
ncbi:MAG: hypothetical protein R3C24_15690 [Cyanobacteriota/Melainabacteria group bacterium]